MKSKNPITAWSYSRLAVFRSCRLQFKFKFIEKLPEPKSDAMERGNQLHLAIQAYLEKRKKALPKEMAKTAGPEVLDIYTRLRKSKSVACELELAVDEGWGRVEWFDKAAWLRVKMDAVEDLGSDAINLYDHKSGKVREGQHTEQLEIYGAIAPSFWPDAKEIAAAMLYVDQAQVATSIFTRAFVMKLRKKWEKEAAPLFREVKFKANPGEACRWCAYSRRRGGPCKNG
jgi:hypothetical protein